MCHDAPASRTRPSRRRAHIRSWPLTLLLGALASWPVERVGAQAAKPATVSRLESTVDPAIKPGDDFFAYANGAWLKATTIPAGKARWGARDEINAITHPRIDQLIDNASAAPKGSSARKVADFRAAWLDETSTEARGLGALKPLLDSIGRIQYKTDLTRFLGRTMPADVDPLNIGTYRSAHVLGFAVERSIHGEKTNDLFLVQGGLGLGDRDQYVSTDARLQSLRTQYQEYIGRMLAQAGFDRSVERAAGVMALETAMAQTQATAAISANDRNADVRWTRADFASKAPGLDWSTFLAAAGFAKQDMFGIWQPSAVTGLAALAQSQPLDVWKDYLRFQALDRYADLLPRAFAEQAAALHAAATGGTVSAVPRAKRALDATKTVMSDAIGKMYAERYFPTEQKKRIQAIVANVSNAFAKRLESVTWMSPASKTIATAKVKSLNVGIAYPDRWQDYADLMVDATDALGNVRRLEAHNTRRALARVGKPVDLTEWWIPAQSVGAVLIFQMNAYQFSAGLLQAPKFDPASSDVAVYGAIGATIGHDVVHYVDLLGADYDTTYAMKHWWTDADHANYTAKTEALIQQFNEYRPFPDVAVNGKLTLPENAADLGGLEASFDAYRLSLGARVSDKAYVKQMDREFFIAFAQSWRTMIGEKAMRAQLATNDHAPEMFRISTMRNMDAWYAAFDVMPGQRLYVEPAARVHIW